MFYPSSYTEANNLGVDLYYTGKPCKHGHLSPRRSKDGSCTTCKEENPRFLGYTKNEVIDSFRDAALQMELKYFTVPFECNHGHKPLRYTIDGKCVYCCRERKKKFREENPEYAAEWRLNNRDKISDYMASWRQDNKDHVSVYEFEYRQNNKPLLNSRNSMRRAKKIDRTVVFHNEEDNEYNEFVIQELFEKSQDLSNLFGEEFHVDHVVPMNGKNISGLHVWYNLDVIKGRENIKKNNKFVPYWENHTTGEIRYNGQ